MFSRTTNTGQNSKHASLIQRKEASSAFVQPKLNVGKPGDKYEVEADKAADQIVAKGKENSASFLAPTPTIQMQSEEEVQRQDTSAGAATENGIQQKPVVDKITPGVQLKSDEEVQTKEDEEVQQKEEEEVQAKEEEIQEKEEEEVQAKEDEEVQQKTEEEVQSKSEDENVQSKTEDESVQQKETTQKSEAEASVPDIKPVVQKQAEEEVQTKEDEEVQEKEDEETVQKQSTSAGDEGGGIESQLNDSKGGGSPMDSATQSEMESGFGADFSGVRVHNDSNAVQMNQELGSQAFTNGNDIYFNEGKYDTNSDSGKHLLAHELTHTVQQGASPSNDVQTSTLVQKEPAKEPAKPGAPATVVDLTKGIKLTKDWLEYIEANPKEKKFDVKVKIGSQYEGTVSLKKLGKPKEGEPQKFELADKKKRYLDVKGMTFLNPLQEAQFFPILVLKNFGDAQATTGFLSVRKGQSALTTDVNELINSINGNLDKMGFLGIDKLKTGGFENKFENGGLNFKANELSVNVDGYVEASGSLGITNSAFTFDVTSNIDVAGMAQGEFNLKRDEKGELAGKATISADIANVNATLTVEYEKGAVTIQGTGKISSEKFSGEITLLVTDEAKSKQMMHAALGVESMDAEKKAPVDPAKPVKKSKGNQVLAGWGTVEATITPWLQGTANVGIDNKGQVTIVGTITVPNEVELMEQRGIKHDLFDVEIRAGYGIPLVGQVFLFASIGMFMNAGFGPLVLKDVAFTGTYSTDPNVLQNFSITGTLGINAFAILGLKAEAGVGVTILGHDVKAGVSVTAAAGIKAYAEATPTFQYQEQKSPQGGKVGESRLKGHFEAAAQLFLQLSGSLFYELDSPWWSPAPDGREDYPLGEVQYPIGDSMGIGADVDWLVGSKEAPELKFSPVEFDPNKFTADVMADPPPRKMGKSDQKPKGKFEDKGGGDQQKDPKATGNGKGLPPNSKKKEDLKNLPDDQKYLRGLDELSKLEKADPKPTVAVVEAKMKKVKSKYGLQTVKIKTMSEAERKKLLTAAMIDLGKREAKIIDKEGKTEEAKAKDMLLGWTKANPIIESAKVVDGKETWDYLIDVGDKNKTQQGKPKSGVEGDGVDENKLDENGKKLVKEVLAMKVPFTNKSKEKHNLDFEKKGKDIELFRKSKPVNVREHLEKIDQAIQNEPKKTQDQLDEEALKNVKVALSDVTGAFADITTMTKEIESIFYKKDDQNKVTDEKKTNFSIEMGEEIRDKLIDIAEALENVPEIKDGFFDAGTSQHRPPSEKVGFKPVTLTLSDESTSTDGQEMTAGLLSRIAPPGLVGSQPNSAGHSELYKILIDNRRNIVAGHLLNHQLFGPGNTTDNLTPIPGPSNTSMETNFETHAKQAVFGENFVIRYVVEAIYDKKTAVGATANGEGIPEEVLIPDVITAEIEKINPKKGKSGEELKNPANWDKENGEKLPGQSSTTFSESGIRSKLAFKGGKLTDLDRLVKLYPAIDRALATKPDITWIKFKDNNVKQIQKILNVSEVADTDLVKSLKEEFLKRQAELGESKETRRYKSFEEVYSLAKRHMTQMIQNIGNAPRTTKGLKGVTESKTHYFGRANSNAAIDLFENEDSKTSALSIASNTDLELGNRLVSKLNKWPDKKKDNEDEILKRLDKDYESFLIQCWSHLKEKESEDAGEKLYNAILELLRVWNTQFTKKPKEFLEEQLNSIKTEIDKLTASNESEKLKRNILQKYEESKLRLSLKGEGAKTDIQRIARILQDIQDGVTRITPIPVIDNIISTFNNKNDFFDNHNISAMYDDLSENSKLVVDSMFGKFKSAVGDKKKDIIDNPPTEEELNGNED